MTHIGNFLKGLDGTNPADTLLKPLKSFLLAAYRDKKKPSRPITLWVSGYLCDHLLFVFTHWIAPCFLRLRVYFKMMERDANEALKMFSLEY